MSYSTWKSGSKKSNHGILQGSLKDLKLGLTFTIMPEKEVIMIVKEPYQDDSGELCALVNYQQDGSWSDNRPLSLAKVGITPYSDKSWEQNHWLAKEIDTEKLLADVEKYLGLDIGIISIKGDIIRYVARTDFDEDNREINVADWLNAIKREGQKNTEFWVSFAIAWILVILGLIFRHQILTFLTSLHIL